MPDIRQQRQQLGVIPPQIRPIWILVNVSHGSILRLTCGDCNNYSPHKMRRIMLLFTADWGSEKLNGLTAMYSKRVRGYNKADCIALRQLTQFILAQICATHPDLKLEAIHSTKISRTDEMRKDTPRKCMFGPRKYALDDFRHIAKCAYFDYQRERILVHTDKKLKAINRQHRKLKRTKIHDGTKPVFIQFVTQQGLGEFQ